MRPPESAFQCASLRSAAHDEFGVKSHDFISNVTAKLISLLGTSSRVASPRGHTLRAATLCKQPHVIRHRNTTPERCSAPTDHPDAPIIQQLPCTRLQQCVSTPFAGSAVDRDAWTPGPTFLPHEPTLQSTACQSEMAYLSGRREGVCFMPTGIREKGEQVLKQGCLQEGARVRCHSHRLRVVGATVRYKTILRAAFPARRGTFDTVSHCELWTLPHRSHQDVTTTERFPASQPLSTRICLRLG